MEPSRIDETLSEEERRLQKRHRPLKIWRSLEHLSPVRRARGILWAPTRALYESWRRGRLR